MLQSHSILNGLSRHVWQSFRPAYSILSHGVLVTMAIQPAKIQEHTCLRKSPGCLFSHLIFVFPPLCQMTPWGRFGSRQTAILSFGVLCPKQPLLCFHCVTQGHLRNGQLHKPQFAAGSHRTPAVREPSYAREDPGGRGHAAPEILYHSMWSREGFVNDFSWADFLLLCGWRNGH